VKVTRFDTTDDLIIVDCRIVSRPVRWVAPSFARHLTRPDAVSTSLNSINKNLSSPDRMPRSSRPLGATGRC